MSNKVYWLTKWLHYSEHGQIRQVFKLSRPKFPLVQIHFGSIMLRQIDVNLTARGDRVEGFQENQNCCGQLKLVLGCQLGGALSRLTTLAEYYWGLWYPMLELFPPVLPYCDPCGICLGQGNRKECLDIDKYRYRHIHIVIEI